MSQITITYRNILENSTVNPSNTNTSYPAYRLYDRDIGKLWIGNSSVDNFYITIDQQSSLTNTIYPVDRVLIPSGHNLNGQGMIIQYSSDNFVGDINTVTSWTQGDANLIDRSPTLNTQRYWRIGILDSTAIPRMPELFIGKDYAFQRNPTYGSRVGYKANVLREETQSGKRMAIQLGELRKTRNYDLAVIETSQKDDFEDWIEHTEGLKPFYITDESDNVIFAELLNDMEFTHKARNNIYSCVIDIVEVI
jgi:hypothetical protein